MDKYIINENTLALLTIDNKVTTVANDLSNEITRISTDTEFNKKKLLNGAVTVNVQAVRV